MIVVRMKTIAVLAFLIALVAPAAAGTTLWTSGVAYTYDAAGNVVGIGTDTYEYDSVDRLVRGSVAGRERSYTYDAFGNRLSCTDVATGSDCQMGALITSATNRVAGGTYDEAGNLQSFSDGPLYIYDSVNMLTRTDDDVDREYVYTADDERIAVVASASASASTWTWTLRDLSGKVLREMTSTSDGEGVHTDWQWTRDHVFRNGLLLSSRQPTGTGVSTRHYHLDHLGTPRVVSDDGGALAGQHDYFPFGLELSGNPTEESPASLRFTGHERDALGDELTALDYMHARFYSAAWGRFLSVDPVLDMKRAMREPQGWNRYSYVMNNPVKSVDPDGRETFVVIVAPAGVDNPKGFAGHTALFVTLRDGRQAGVSYGGAHDFKRAGMLGFINDYNAEGRSVTVYKLKTTPAQDAKMGDFLKQNPDGGVNPDAGRMARAMVTENCTTAACNTLKAGGVVGKNEDPNGALSGAHKPNELKQALEPGGDLSNRVQQKWVFEPEKKEKKEQQ